MADILIKNIGMPKEGHYYLEVFFDGEIRKCTNPLEGFVNTDATAIELPPHGRLIDADRLKGIIRKANEDCISVGKYERAKQWSDAEFYVDHAPVVLEAST